MQEPKINYIHSQFRVRCEFTKGYCDLHKNPPANLIQRAIRKLAFEMAVGNIDSYDFFGERLRNVWARFRESKSEATDTIAVTLATGCPTLPGILIRPNISDHSVVANISIKATADMVIDWRPELFKYYVATKIRNLVPGQLFDIAELYGIWYQASLGNQIKNVPIHRIEPPNDLDSSFRVRAIDGLGVVATYLYDIQSLKEKRQLQNLLVEVNRVAQAKYGPKNYIILKDDLIKKIKSSSRGVERFGLDLPIVMVTAIKQHRNHVVTKIIRQPSSLKHEQEEDINSEEMFLKKYSEYIGISSSPDHLVGMISLDRKVYMDFPALNRSWIQRILIKKGYAIDNERFQKIDTYLQEHSPISNFIFFEGRLPQHADAPFLYPIFREEHSVDENTRVNFRSRNIHNLVRAGETIAEVRFSTPASDGIDIFGKKLPAKTLTTLQCELGDGIEDLGNGQYRALWDGLPHIDKHRITLKKLLIHEGNVNFATGDIIFDGPVIIKGDVEGGATIKIVGDVTVEGSIIDSKVDIKGSLYVKQGIRSSGQCHIKVEGDLNVDFIENSVVEVSNLIEVTKGILGGLIICGGELELKNAASQIYACSIYIYGNLNCQNLGKNTAKRTDIYLGLSYKMSKRAVKIEKRITHFGQIKTESENEKNQLEQSKDPLIGVNTKKDKIHSLERRVKRLEIILKTLDHQLRLYSKGIINNPQSHCRVHKEIAKNCYFHIGSQIIKVPTDMVSVSIRYNDKAKQAKDFFLPILETEKSA